MTILEQKKIIIKLPQLHWRLFLSLRFFIILSLLLFSSAFAYWYHAIRPYFWITSAHVEAFSTIVSSDMAGRIVEMGPQEGDFVKKGQTLFILDRDLILAKQMQAKLNLDTLNGQIEMEKGRIGKAMEEYLAATNELDETVIKRQLELMEEAQNKSELAFSQIAAAKTELAFLDLQVKKMTLTAPFDGIILKRSKNLGSVVSFGDPIYILCDPARLWIEAEVSENQIGQIAIGTPAAIRLPAYPNKEFAGKVSWIGPATVAKSSLLPFSSEKATLPIKISLENPNPALKPGLSAHIALKVH